MMDLKIEFTNKEITPWGGTEHVNENETLFSNI